MVRPFNKALLSWKRGVGPVKEHLVQLRFSRSCYLISASDNCIAVLVFRQQQATTRSSHFSVQELEIRPLDTEAMYLQMYAEHANLVRPRLAIEAAGRGGFCYGRCRTWPLAQITHKVD
jgi:hypothetical protein